MLPRGHFDNPEGAQDDASYQCRFAMIEVADEEGDETGEDRDLGDRDPPEGTRRTFAAVLAPLRWDRAGRRAGPAAFTRATLGALTGHGAAPIVAGGKPPPRLECPA